ncbi:3-oxoacyl-[acyl-carrier protein] reductase [Microdochium nivale]|nr:3-oxoacyl-[acyl-carrier protein] reductase [Microdochium nivale]
MSAAQSSLNFLVTGAGRGIGRGLSRLLLQRGHRVFLLDNNAEELQHTVSTVLSGIPQAQYASSQTDLRKPAEIRDAAARVADFFDNHLDVLVNNAAVTSAVGESEFADLSLEDWNASLETNLTAPFLLSQACLPMLKARPGGAGAGAGGAEARETGGAIIHMSSTRAHQSEPNSEPYAATKAGLLGLTHSMASSLAPLGITVNAILPGWINVANECKEADDKGARWEDGLADADHQWHFSGRVGRVEDIAAAVEFLARERFVNGHEFVVDGGVTKKMVYNE